MTGHPAFGNVIPLRRTGNAKCPDQAPLLHVAEGDRPAPLRIDAEARLRLAFILFISLTVHIALFVFLRAEPEMMASAGEDAITVEIIVGADAAAGTTQARSDTEAEQQPAMDARQDETAQEKFIKKETPTDPEPKVTSAEGAIAPIQTEVTAPEQTIEDTPPEPKPLEPSRPKPTPPTAPAPAANSIGRGRMTAGDANYQGLVAARLARFKRFPPEARRRREQGSALVDFTIDSAGRATSVRLVRGTGFDALDGEVQAMVRRASPFPPPPSGAAMTFSAPVTFHLK